MTIWSIRGVLRVCAFLLLDLGIAVAGQPFIVMASTTSTEQSGLFGHVLPIFTAASGIEVRVIAQGTGHAIDTARRGDADLLFVHDRASEEKFVSEGFGGARRDVMYNDFVVIGPRQDPADIGGSRDVVAALRAISAQKATFLSRGDRSGTHSPEMRYWQAAGIDPGTAGKGSWYRETGSGMGPTLNVASATNGHALSDRATWLAFANPGELAILVEGDERMFSQYGVVVVDPMHHPRVKADLAPAFADWVVSPQGQREIAALRVGGQQLFFPNAAAAQ